MIIDSQVHLWQAATPEWPFVHDDVHMDEPVTIERLQALMAGAGVDRAVIVPPSWVGERNDYGLEAARRFPDQFAVMGRLAVESPGAPAQLETFIEPGMLGVRLTFLRPRELAMLAEGATDWFWPAAERLDLPVMVHGPEVLPALGDIARRHPGLRLIVDHLGIRGTAGLFRDEKLAGGIDELVALAPIPNVFVKTSCVPALSTDPYPYRNIFDQLARVIHTFGPERCFWGTDYSRLPGTYREAVTMFTEEIDFLNADEKALVMGDALATCLRWPR